MGHPGLHIGDFAALPGLTRLTTLEREAIHYVLRRFRKVRPAARWLGIHYNQVYRKLRLYESLGCPIAYRILEQEHRGPRAHRQIGRVGVKELLRRLGVDLGTKRLRLSAWPRVDQEEAIRHGKKAWLQQIRVLHPDMETGDVEKAAALNATWAALKKWCVRNKIEH